MAPFLKGVHEIAVARGQKPNLVKLLGVFPDVQLPPVSGEVWIADVFGIVCGSVPASGEKRFGSTAAPSSGSSTLPSSGSSTPCE